MPSSDSRWKQRFDSYLKVLTRLEEAVAIQQKRELMELEKQGTIKGFEYTYELAWKVIQDYFRYQGNNNILGSRNAIRTAFQNGLIADGDVWMQMIVSRNKTSHTYNEAMAEEVYQTIIDDYFQAFQAFANKMKTLL